MSRIGRKQAVAPPGFLTIAAAAAELGLSYSGVYRHLGLTDAIVDESGVILIPRNGLVSIREAMRKPAAGQRAVTIRPTPEEFGRWERHIARRHPDVSVGQWLRQIANQRAGAK